MNVLVGLLGEEDRVHEDEPVFGFRVKVWGLGFRVRGLRFDGLMCRVWDRGFRV